MMGQVLRQLFLMLLCTVFAVDMARAQSCTFSVSGVNFGNVDTLSGAAVDTTATVNITCGGAALGARVRVCLNIGEGTGGQTSGTRHMRDALNRPLNYNLYQDPSRTILWGTTSQPALGNPVAVNLSLPAGGGSVSASRTIYGRVLGNQQSTFSGAYSSSFAGAHTRFNWQTYLVTPPACSTVTLNPIRSAFTVQANVIPNCRVTAKNINFGNHGVLDAAVDATGGLGVTCTPGTAYNVGLNNGLTGTGPTARRMTRSGQAVLYGLYKDSARSNPWGNTGTQRLAGTGTGATQSIPVYGRVPAQQTPAPGTYTDTVVVTVTY